MPASFPKSYLNFGGGVNSVAQILFLEEKGWEFESVYVWMPDWPETHDYIMMLESRGYKITTIFPWHKHMKVTHHHWNLYDCLFENKLLPVTFNPVTKKPIRICTRNFKINTLHHYFQKPCFSLIGIDFGEIHRAIFRQDKGIENRFPLIEYELTRDDCVKIIKRHGLPVPIKSGCFFCPYQPVPQWRELRRKHPDLFCKATKLEAEIMKRTKSTLRFDGIKIKDIVEEQNRFLFKEMSYPPCNCWL